MHILLGALGAIVTILVLLHRLADIGVDLGGLNPFAWRRRRAWRQKFEGNPVFALQDPREIAAVLLVGAAKIDGDLSGDEKRAVMRELEQTLSMQPQAASQLLTSTVFMLGNMQVMTDQVDELLARYSEHLSEQQVDSLLEIVERIVALDGGATPRQRELADKFRSRLKPDTAEAGTWG